MESLGCLKLKLAFKDADADAVDGSVQLRLSSGVRRGGRRCDPLSDLSPRSRADPMGAQVNPSKGPRLGTPFLCLGDVEDVGMLLGALWTSWTLLATLLAALRMRNRCSCSSTSPSRAPTNQKDGNGENYHKLLFNVGLTTFKRSREKCLLI